MSGLGYRLICDGCGIIFWRRTPKTGKRAFCGTSCRDEHPFKRQPRDPRCIQAALDALAQDKSWYEIGKERGLNRRSIRIYYKRFEHEASVQKVIGTVQLRGTQRTRTVDQSPPERDRAT
jgi:hypothetical protein